MNQEILSAKAN